MAWFECKRTDAGRKVFSAGFMYCRACKIEERVDEQELILFSDGGLTWFKASKEGSKKFFDIVTVDGETKTLDPSVADAIEENYQMSLKRESK